jgi:hypothetical protein
MSEGILTIAYPDDSLAAIVFNLTGEPLKFAVAIAGEGATSSRTPAHGIQAYATPRGLTH